MPTSLPDLRALFSGLPAPFWLIFWASIINRAASFVGVFLAIHLRQDLGFSPAIAGWVVGLWGLGGAIASPVGGALADSIGRRTTMLVGLTLGGCCVLTLAFVSDPLAAGVLSFAGGATHQIFTPAANALVADVVPMEHRPNAYGHLYWALNIGLGFGYLVAGLLTMCSIPVLFVADACTSFVSAAIIAWQVPETRPAAHAGTHEGSGWGGLVRDHVFLLLLLLHFAALLIFTQFFLALPLDMAAHGVAARPFALLMCFNCLGVVALQPWIGPRLRRMDRSWLLAIGTLLFGVGYGVNAFVGSIPLYLLGVGLWTLGEVFALPSSSSVVADLAPPSMRGRYHGAFSMTWALAATVSPVLGGEVLQRFGSQALWIGCAAVGGAVALGHGLAAPSRRRAIARVGGRGTG